MHLESTYRRFEKMSSKALFYLPLLTNHVVCFHNYDDTIKKYKLKCDILLSLVVIYAERQIDTASG